MVFRFINQQITKSSETNLVYLNEFDYELEESNMILAKLTFIAIAIVIGTLTELKVHRQKVILLRLWTTRLKEQIKNDLPAWKLCKISHESTDGAVWRKKPSQSQPSRQDDESQLSKNHLTIMSDSETNQSR